MRSQNKPLNFVFSRVVRFLILVFGLLICAFGGWASARTGLASLLATYGPKSEIANAADEAVRLSPLDPDVRVLRGGALFSEGRLEEARDELEAATSLRPLDFRIWQEYGRLCDLTNDEAQAKAALRQAVNLAPNYAKPRWQLGNLLLREGRAEEAFPELRRAAESDRSLGPNLVDLAWGAFDGDAAAIENAIGKGTDADRIRLAGLFIKHGKKTEAKNLLGELGAISDRDRSRLIDEMVEAKFFHEAHAFSLQTTGGPAEQKSSSIAMISNGGFEKAMNPSEKGFGWRSLPKSASLNIALDTTLRHTGRSSLRFDWDDKVDAATPLAWQIAAVEPNQRYTLSFAAKTADLVSGALPTVIVTDATQETRTLSNPVPVAGGSSDWKIYTVDFLSGGETEAVRIVIQRQSCSMLPCPIFGKTWFDDFSLTPASK